MALQLAHEIKWDSSQFGQVGGLGCDTNGVVYVVAGNGLYRVTPDDIDKLHYLRDLTQEAPLAEQSTSFSVVSICFDTLGRIYITSNWYGLQVFQSADSSSVDFQLPASEWQGPIQLSQPSKSIIGVNYATNPKGQLSTLEWNDDKLVLRTIPGWGDDFGYWLGFEFGDLKRDPAISIRRAWYKDRIMVYLVDQGSALVPEDGIRTLHMMFGTGTNKISELIHTYLSCPWDEELKMPFNIEIPHNSISSELVISTPRGIITERGQILVDFSDSFDSDASYSSVLYSTTDFDGSATKRNWYINAFHVNQQNVLRILQKLR
jgi:hypothetical protein